MLYSVCQATLHLLLLQARDWLIIIDSRLDV